MDGNKDESARCIRLAEEYLGKKAFKKAYRFAEKAHRLYPTDQSKRKCLFYYLFCILNCRVLEFLDKTKLLAEKFESEEDSSRPEHQETSSSRESTSETFSNEQAKKVDYIKNCKDYYEILGVAKNASDVEIKKQYRKLALQFHPDKNKTPGAAEAFKAIGNAFAVLSDTEKRRRYDQIGTDDSYEYVRRRRRSNGFDYTRGFEEEFNPEEIFNMFFGGGFPSRNVYVYRNGNMYHQRPTHHAAESQGSPGYAVLLQIMPIILFICISLLSNFVPDNPYSLSRSQ